ncbi:amidohydrolase family protein [Marinimicrobium sp. C2-29]|uniref:amidohydrolase family protein n=1 Tax=Marinimicrobium sp. C2-29 TaxID=3139825 RepID=UPI003139D33C
MTTMVIDAHQHCWQLQRPECQWPTPELPALYRDFGPEDWRAQALPQGVAGSVLVQSQPDERDTDYLLSLADRHDWILGVVGWVDLKAADAPERIAALSERSKLRGLRPMLQALEDDHWIDDPALDPAIAAMVENRLVFDALVYTRHLPPLRRFARRHEALTIVLDHAAKPPIATGERRAWQREMQALAEAPNIYCKLSGLLTEAGTQKTLEHLQPWVDDLLAWFGPQRLLWGSDWPVVNAVADYAHWSELTGQLLAALTESERSAVWGETARRVYRLK